MIWLWIGGGVIVVRHRCWPRSPAGGAIRSSRCPHRWPPADARTTAGAAATREREPEPEPARGRLTDAARAPMTSSRRSSLRPGPAVAPRRRPPRVALLDRHPDRDRARPADRRARHPQGGGRPHRHQPAARQGGAGGQGHHARPASSSTSAVRDRWVLVNFFASWCVPCRQEHPELRAFQQEHAAKGDVALVSVVYGDETGRRPSLLPGERRQLAGRARRRRPHRARLRRGEGARDLPGRARRDRRLQDRQRGDPGRASTGSSRRPRSPHDRRDDARPAAAGGRRGSSWLVVLVGRAHHRVVAAAARRRSTAGSGRSATRSSARRVRASRWPPPTRRRPTPSATEIRRRLEQNQSEDQITRLPRQPLRRGHPARAVAQRHRRARVDRAGRRRRRRRSWPSASGSGGWRARPTRSAVSADDRALVDAAATAAGPGSAMTAATARVAGSTPMSWPRSKSNGTSCCGASTTSSASTTPATSTSTTTRRCATTTPPGRPRCSRAIDAAAAGLRRRPADRRSTGRIVAIVAGVLVFAVVAGVLVAQALGGRAA